MQLVLRTWRLHQCFSVLFFFFNWWHDSDPQQSILWLWRWAPFNCHKAAVKLSVWGFWTNKLLIERSKISPFYSTLAKYEISSEAWYPYIASQSHTRMEWFHLNLSFIFWLRVNHVQNISRPFFSSGFKWTFQKSNRPLNANFHPTVILVNFFFSILLGSICLSSASNDHLEM